MKFSTLCVCLGLAAAAAWAESSAAVPEPAKPEVIEMIIAKVNGDIITRGEIERTKKQIVAELRQKGADDAAIKKTVDELSKDLLRERIDQLLLVQKANQLSISVDSDLSKIFADIQLQNKIADPEKFQEWIRQQAGMPFEDFKAEYKNNLLKQRVLRQEVGGRISISKAEARKYYEEHKSEFVRQERVFLRELFLSTEGKEGMQLAAIEKKAKDLVARARKGEKFYELARDNSEAATASQGGELGGFERGQLAKNLEDLVFNQERGYVTDPIKTGKGFLILRVEERHNAGQAAFEEVENEIMEKLYVPRYTPKVREYLTKLREEAFLEIRDGYIDTGAAPGKDTRWQDPAQLKPETVTKEEVAARPRRKRLFWLVPIPGTKTKVESESPTVK